MSAPRNIKDGPFAWQSKAALARIAAACDSRTDKAHVIAVYVAMTWEASNRQVETFDIHVRHVAAIAGVSYKKAGEVLALLGSLGLIVSRANFIHGTKEKGANTYTLGTVCPTLGTINPRLGTAAKPGTSARVLEESSEESLEENRRPAARTPSLEEWKAYTSAKYTDWPEADAQGAWEHYESIGWKKGKTPVVKWKLCASTCYRNYQARRQSSQPAPQPARNYPSFAA